MIKQENNKLLSEAEGLERKAKSLKSQIQKNQNDCSHKWNEIKYDPEDFKEEYATGAFETHGVHHWPITAYRDAKKDRWSRECSECGKTEFTYAQKEVKTKTPKF